MIDVDKFPQVGQRLDEMKSEKQKYIDLYQQAPDSVICSFFPNQIQKINEAPHAHCPYCLLRTYLNYLANSISK